MPRSAMGLTTAPSIVTPGTAALDVREQGGELVGRSRGGDVEPNTSGVGLVRDIGGDDLERAGPVERLDGGGGLLGGADQPPVPGGDARGLDQPATVRFAEQPAFSLGRPQAMGQPEVGALGGGGDPVRAMRQRRDGPDRVVDRVEHRDPAATEDVVWGGAVDGVAALQQKWDAGARAEFHELLGGLLLLGFQPLVEPQVVAAEQADHDDQADLRVVDQGLRGVGEQAGSAVGCARDVHRIADRGGRPEQGAQGLPGVRGERGERHVAGRERVDGQGGVAAAVAEHRHRCPGRGRPAGGEDAGDDRQFVAAVDHLDAGLAQDRAGHSGRCGHGAGVGERGLAAHVRYSPPLNSTTGLIGVAAAAAVRNARPSRKPSQCTATHRCSGVQPGR